MFCEEKVSQMAGYLLFKGRGRMKYIKLMKLLYLCDRESYRRYGESMTGDIAVSMDKGPVLSKTYNLLKEGGSEPESSWERWIAGEANWEVSLKMTVQGCNDESSFDELSLSDRRILDSVFAEYGHIRPFDLCALTHDVCPEWQAPNGSQIPIKPADILRALGNSESQITQQLLHNHEQEILKRFSAQLS